MPSRTLAIEPQFEAAAQDLTQHREAVLDDVDCDVTLRPPRHRGPREIDRSRSTGPARRGLSRRFTVAGSPAVFRREGKYWTVRYGEEIARLPDRKGMRYLAALLSAPGREIHVFELLRAADPASAAPVALSALRGEVEFAAGGFEEAILDPRAKAEFRQRLLDLEEDLEEARSGNDVERAVRIEAEIDAITHELASAAGLGGRDRRLPSPTERARVSVTKAIRGAVRAVAADCPELGRHLDASVRTGRLCSYAPTGQAAPAWRG